MSWDAAGHFTVIDVLGATATSAIGINNAGQIAGSFYTGPLGQNENHGFLRSPAGRLTTINVTLPGAYGTVVHGINAAGDMVGEFFDGQGKQRGFLRTAAGAFATIAVPASLMSTSPSPGSTAHDRSQGGFSSRPATTTCPTAS